MLTRHCLALHAHGEGDTPRCTQLTTKGIGGNIQQNIRPGQVEKDLQLAGVRLFPPYLILAHSSS